MGVTGNRFNRSAGNKGKGTESEELLRLSLEGKWISLARRWVELNAPCTVQHYLRSITPLMPTHLVDVTSRGGNKRFTQMQLARSTLTRNLMIVEGETIVGLRPKKRKLYNHLATLNKHITSDGIITLPKESEFDNTKEWHAFSMWVRNRATWIAPRQYRFDSDRGSDGKAN